MCCVHVICDVYDMHACDPCVCVCYVYKSLITFFLGGSRRCCLHFLAAASSSWTRSAFSFHMGEANSLTIGGPSAKSSLRATQ